MSFNRLAYDTCESKIAIQESVAPGVYQINTPVLCNTCFQDNPQIINQRGGVSMNANTDWRFNAGPIDVETDLMNINRPATNCPSGKFQPKCPNCNIVLSGQPCGQGVAEVCKNCSMPLPKGAMCNQDLVNMPDCHFPVENTRLSNPPSTLRGTGWNRFEYLCLDPQADLFFPGKLDEDTRLVARDNFKPCVRTPKVNSMHPDEKWNNRCEQLNIQSSLHGYGEPLHMKRERCGK